MKDWAKEAVKRFYRTMTHHIMELLKDGAITEDMTVKEVLAVCEKKKEEAEKAF